MMMVMMIIITTCIIIIIIIIIIILLLLYRCTMIQSARHIPLYAKNATKMKFHVQR